MCYLASTLGVVVVSPDYDTAPAVRYPVSEEQAFDVAEWILRSGDELGWDAERFAVSGASSGAKLAIGVCQQLFDAKLPAPRAAALIVPVTDVTRADRTSSIPKPAISPFVQRMVERSYFADVTRRREPLASPRLDAQLASKMPDTLILTAEHDTLRPEGDELASRLLDAGVDVEFSSYRAVDHGFAVDAPAPIVAAVLEQIGEFLGKRLR